MAIKTNQPIGTTARPADAFDVEGWNGKWNALLDKAKAAGLSAKDLVDQSKDLFTELREKGSADSGKVFYDAMSAKLGAEAATAFVMESLDVKPEYVKKNLGEALKRIANKAYLTAKAPTDIPAEHQFKLTGVDGKDVGSIIINDICTTQAHITICPEHTSEFLERGGGLPGGIAKAWRNRAAKLGNEAFRTATYAFQADRGTSTLAPGDSGTYDTGLTDLKFGPMKMVVIGSVPKKNLRLNAGTNILDGALTAQRQGHQLQMSAIALREALIAASELQASPDGPKFTADNPAIISRPILCTGPDGSVTEIEAALTDRQVFDPSSPVHQKILQELKDSGVDVPPFKVVTCFFNPDAQGAGVLDTVKKYAEAFNSGKVEAQWYPSAAERLAKIIQHMGSEEGNRPFSTGILAARVDEAMEDVKRELSQILPGTIEAAKADPGYISTFFGALGNSGINMTYQMARMLMIPELAKSFGVTAFDLPTQVAQLCGNEDFKAKVAAQLSLHKNFGEALDRGNLCEADSQRLIDAIHLAAEQIMQESRWQHLDAFYDKYEKEMGTISSGISEQMEGLKGKLASFDELKSRVEALTTQNSKLEEQAEELAKELELALNAKDAAEVQGSQLAQDLAKEIAASAATKQSGAQALRDMDDLRDQVSTLMRQLRDQKDLTAQYKSQAEAKQSYPRSSPSVSTSSY